ncbi:hypothetical protein BST95_19395 (plasmid) [Halioglobus japonicus]|nr:Stealth CR1 domain-containing protein [Halioglobus japonicus]AQA20411.1 hypothetical protein BST95_19395 [Halioglobus japonicus]
MNAPIDAVYTWVNDSDPIWRCMVSEARRQMGEEESGIESSASVARFQNRNELVYSIKSLRKHAPWIRRVYVVSNCELPAEIAHADDVEFVHHEAIFPTHQCCRCSIAGRSKAIFTASRICQSTFSI